MKKVSIIIMEKDSESFLEKLRETGVIHLKTKRVSSEALGSLMRKKAKIASARGILRKYPVKKDAPVPSGEITIKPDTAEHILSLAEEMDVLRSQLPELAIERLRVAPWGDFDPSSFEYLENNGVKLIPYEIPRRVCDKLGPDIKIIVISEDKFNVRALAVGAEIPSLSPFKFFTKSVSEISNDIESINNRIKEIEAEFTSLAYRKEIIEAESSRLLEDIDFETARAGMESTKDDEEIPAELAVSWATGYVPEERIDELKKTAAGLGWVLLSEDPAPIDLPPTLLKTNKVSKIAQPLFGLLGVVPGYWEKDVSISFMIFFCIFTAMIFGDAAYGLFILVIAVIVGLLMKKKGGVFPDGVKLIMLMAFFTICWGSMTGAWFAIPVQNLPGFLRALILPPFNNTGPLAEFPVFLQKYFNLPAQVPVDALKTQWNVRFLCFTIALVQLLWGHLTNLRSLLPSLAAIAQLGWMLMMVGLYFLVLFMLLNIDLPSFAIYFIGIGLGIYFVFAEQNGGNFFINILRSFGNFISIFLKAISSFADIISYIRLFAVGLTGSMIAQTFNSMAIPAEGFGKFGLIFIVRLIAAILILALGHGLNMAMNSLSLIVHGARLNLLEYASNHLNMSWSGYGYNPFAHRQKK